MKGPKRVAREKKNQDCGRSSWYDLVYTKKVKIVRGCYVRKGGVHTKFKSNRRQILGGLGTTQGAGNCASTTGGFKRTGVHRRSRRKSVLDSYRAEKYGPSSRSSAERAPGMAHGKRTIEAEVSEGGKREERGVRTKLSYDRHAG